MAASVFLEQQPSFQSLPRSWRPSYRWCVPCTGPCSLIVLHAALAIRAAARRHILSGTALGIPCMLAVTRTSLRPWSRPSAVIEITTCGDELTSLERIFEGRTECPEAEGIAGTHQLRGLDPLTAQ